MNELDRFDETILDWFAGASPADVPRRVVDAATTQARRTRRARPLPDFMTRFLPMTTNFAAARPLIRPRPVARLGPIGVLIALALLALALIGAALLSVGVSPAPPAGVSNGLIAYDAFGDIWLVRPDGTDAQQLTSGTQIDISPSWSPDGSHIAFLRNPNSTVVNPTGQNFSSIIASMSSTPSIVIVDADGSHPTTLDGVRGISWSPDGQRVVYSTGTGLRIVDADGANGVDLLTPGDAPAWSPDGRFIAYVGGSTTTSDQGVWVVGSDGSDPHRVSAPVGIGTGVNGIVWSPDGSHITFFAGPSTGGANDVRVVAADATGEIAVTTAGPDEYWPVWSPDGSRLAFDRVVAPNNLVQVVVAASDGSEQTLVDSEHLFGNTPVWAPDGTAILMQLPDDPALDSSTGWASHLVVLDPASSAPSGLIPARGAYGLQSWQRVAR